MNNTDAIHGERPPDLTTASSDPLAPTREELQAFIQANTYYYLPKWDALDPTLRAAPKGTFNWAACFLWQFWMAYRKMYLFAVICVVSFFVLNSILLSLGVPFYYGLFLMWWFGRYGSALYKRHAIAKIRQIKSTIAPEYWPQAFKDKGGTSFWAVVPFIIWLVFTYFIMFWSMGRQ